MSGTVLRGTRQVGCCHCAGAHPQWVGVRELALLPFVHFYFPEWRVGRDFGMPPVCDKWKCRHCCLRSCAQCFPLRPHPHSTPTCRCPHQHFVAKKAGSGGPPAIIQLLEARSEHRAFPSAGSGSHRRPSCKHVPLLTTSCTWSRVAKLFKAKPRKRILTVPPWQKIFVLGILSKIGYLVLKTQCLISPFFEGKNWVELSLRSIYSSFLPSLW